ncbi:MAG: hypothetical protein Q8L35_07890 [Actinomycetota bacterium]|nr:hypothetical protein [Actinomycetota bacterium]
MPEDFQEDLAEEEIEAGAAERRRGCRTYFNWLVGLFLLIFLLALLWPVTKSPKKEVPQWVPPKYSVSKPKTKLLVGAKLSKLKLRRSSRGRYILVAFKLENRDARIANLSYDKFQLIVKQGRLTKEITAHRASELLGSEGESSWGQGLDSGKTVDLEAVFLIPNEAQVQAFRVHEADWRSNKYIDIPLTVPPDRPKG